MRRADAVRPGEVSTSTELMGLLPSVDALDDLPVDALPGFILQLTALQARAAARLVERATESRADPANDELLDVKQAAARLNVSRDWLYRNASTLPFARRLSARALRFSAHEIDRWLGQVR